MARLKKVAVDSFWEYAAFVVNSLVFLLIGIEIQLSLLADYAVLILWAILARTLARAITIYGFFPITNRFTERVSFRWQHIVFWGGLRGSLSIALVLSLPLNLPGRKRLVAMTGAVTFSLLVQGLIISPLMTLQKIERTD
ncbi:MAG: cation:proton antiporter [Acidobacteriota bacterium]|nr:cation:proton antiporter [Acidobacteriota bacterium]